MMRCLDGRRVHPERRRPVTIQRVLLAAPLVASCGGEANGGPAVAVRDSAGIEIIESPAAVADRPWAFRLGDPVADIGVVDGAPEYQLFRVTSAVALADGRIVVANGGTQELRFFDSDGRFLFSRGGRGDGPGDYQLPMIVPSPFPDSLFVFDLRASRVTVLDLDGQPVRTVPAGGFVSEPIGMIAADRLAFIDNTASAGMDAAEMLQENGRLVQIATLGAAQRDTLATYDGPGLFLWHVGNRIGFTQVPFDVSPTAAIGNGRLFVTPGRESEVHELGRDGRLLRILRVGRELEPITRDLFEAFVERQVGLEADPAEAAEVRRRYGETPIRERMPAYRRLLVDASDNVWAERYREDTSGPSTWTIFDASGQAAGSLTVPAGARLLSAGADRVLAVQRDEMDVEHVVAWPLIPVTGESSN